MQKPQRLCDFFCSAQLICVTFVILAATAVAQPTLQPEIYSARDKVLPALVHVEPVKNVYNRGEKQRALVTGSGVIFTKDGYVLTNHHVAGNAERVWCTLTTKERITATVVGSDPSTDIAVLQLSLNELANTEVPYAKLGNSDSLETGQFVLALGSPLGLSRSLSMGVVSSIDRYFPDRGTMISPYNTWIQTDAAINPGNSGGPLIDLDGNVIGINARAVFLADNLGFAIPINLVKEVADEIIQGQTVRRSWIGVSFQEIKYLREYLKKPEFEGVLVSNVETVSPAARAGIRPGDVVQTINGARVNAIHKEDLPSVRHVITKLNIERESILEIWRDGNRMNVSVKAIEEPLREDDPEIEAEQWGFVVRNLSWFLYHIHMMSDVNGVYITSVKPGGPGEEANLRNGDVIRLLNGKEVTNSDTFQALFEEFAKKPEEKIFVELIRNGFPYFTVIQQENVGTME